MNLPTQEVQDNLILDYTSHKLILKAIKEKYKLSLDVIYKILANHKVELKRPAQTITVTDSEFTEQYNSLVTKDLCKKYNTTAWAISKHAKKLGLAKPAHLYKKLPSYFTDEQLQIIKKSYVDDKQTITAIGEKLDCAQNRVYWAIQEHGWKDNASGVQQRRTKTFQEKYGVNSPLAVPVVREKIKQTCIQRYGVANPFQSAECRLKGITTMLERYGSVHPHNYGKSQNELKEWLSTITSVEFKTNHSVLLGKEIDLYSDELKLGIEYCGLYWHTENSPEPRDRHYHYNKYKTAKDKGVRLITIFEDEWLSRNAQVKGALASILNKNSRHIMARKCIVKTIDKLAGNQFYSEYHIQGPAKFGEYFAGLYYENELLGVLSFGKHHRDTSKYVLDRLCFKADVSVAGGAGKLFSYLVETSGITELISWSDNRWFDGQVYSKLGFVLESELPADYSYVAKDNLSRISKQSQQKKKVDCPAGLTEKEWCAQRGLFRIWDCGKKCWKWTAPVKHSNI